MGETGEAPFSYAPVNGPDEDVSIEQSRRSRNICRSVETEVADEDRQDDDNQNYFMPSFVPTVCNTVFWSRKWDQAIYMNSDSFVLIPPVILFLELPIVFIITLFFGWIISLRVALSQGGKVRDWQCCRSTQTFWWQFCMVFFGSAAPLMQLILKFVLFRWRGIEDTQPRDLVWLWTTHQLSGVELLAPFVPPVLVACMVTHYVYEYSLAQAAVYNIGEEFDERGFFHIPVKSIGDYLDDLGGLVTFDDGGYKMKLRRVPLIDCRGTEFSFEEQGESYAAQWALDQIGKSHPLALHPISHAANVALIGISLAPALLPYVWMKLSHPEQYLSSPLVTVKVSAFVSFLCIFLAIWKVLQFWWAAWRDFALVRYHVLVILYLSASEAGRHYVYRLWRLDVDKMQINSKAIGQIHTPTHATTPRQRTPEYLQSAFVLDRSIKNPQSLERKRTAGESIEDIEESLKEEDRTFRSLVRRCRKHAFPKADFEDKTTRLNFKENVGGIPALDLARGSSLVRETQLEHWLDQMDFRSFTILDVEMFGWLRGCLKPNVMIARVRLESCLLGSAFITVVSGTSVLLDYQAPPVGDLSVFGMMSVWSFVFCAIFVIICVHSAVMMNMALIDSSLEVLRQWKMRISQAAFSAQSLEVNELSKTFSQYRVQFNNKFRSMQEHFDYVIGLIKDERPLTFAFIPLTPSWRNRLILSLIGTVLIATMHYVWGKITKSVSDFHAATSSMHEM